MARWSRLQKIEEKDKKKLEKIVGNTPGMTLYGHRARTAIMLPVDVAQYISKLSKRNKSSVSQTIVDLIKDQIVREQGE